MNSLKLGSVLSLIFSCVPFPSVASSQEKITPKTQMLIDDLEKVLPEYEKAADSFEKAVLKYANTSDRNVLIALDSATQQIQSIRSVRKIIAEAPGYLQFHIGPANLLRWKEGAEYFLERAVAEKDPFADMTNGVRPFRSKIDGQVLLYKFSLPKDYDAAK